MLLMIVLAGWASAARADVDAAQFQKDVEAIASQPTRHVGTAGFYQTADWLRAQIKELGPNVELQEHTFKVVVPVTEKAELKLNQPLENEGPEADRVYPFWPASVRVNATPAEGIKGKLVYIGEARFEQIVPRDVYGNIAVVESNATWGQAAYFGAKAVIVLENRGSSKGSGYALDQTSHLDLRNHELLIPANIPRFYMPDDAAHHGRVEALRKGKLQAEAKLFASVSLKEVEATNFYALVRPPQLQALRSLPQAAQWLLGRTMNFGPAGWDKSVNPASLLVSVPYDASSLVPDLAPGASQAVQTAAALSLLRDAAKQPLARPLLVSFTAADSQQMRGTRELMLALADPPSIDRGWKDQLAELAKKEAALKTDLDRATALKGDPTGLNVTTDRSLIDRIIKIAETDIYFNQDELFRVRRTPVKDMTPAIEARINEMEERSTDLGAVRHGLQQRPADLGKTFRPSCDPGRIMLGARSSTQPAPSAASNVKSTPTEEQSLLPDARSYLKLAVERMERLKKDYAFLRQRLERRIELYHWVARATGRNPNPEQRATNARLIEAMVGIDLSDHGNRVGPMTYGYYYRSDSASNVLFLKEWLDGQEKKKAAWLEQSRGVLELGPLGGNNAKSTWMSAPLALPSEVAQSWGIPGLSLVTLSDLRLSRDTPLDSMEQNPPKLSVIVPQLRAVRSMLFNGWNDPALKSGVEGKWARNINIEGQVVSPAVGRPVPDLPREGFCATYFYAESKKAPKLRNLPFTLGMRKFDIVPTDAEGNYRFEGLTRLTTSDAVKELSAGIAVEVFKFSQDPKGRPDGTGRIVACSDLGRQSGDIKVFADPKTELEPLRSLVFDCEEFTLPGLYDPRFLQDLGELTIVDQRRNAEPQRYGFMIHRQIMAGFVEPGQSSYLLFRYGRVGNRLVLLNSREQFKGRPRGMLVRPAEPNAVSLTTMKMPALQTTWDFWYLNDQRLSEYRQASVTNSMLDGLHAQSKKLLDESEAAWSGGKNAEEVMRLVNGAWANEARVYIAAQDMANDVVRGAIFLLLLCIPFAFCMERLLVGTPNIYKQIAWTFVIFAIMAAALSQFHPAFRISKSPLIIILSFAIIFMSIVVISVVYGKFDTELKRIRSGRGTAMATSFARASVLMSAVLLGIANMRKRKFRTTLTCITVVLITFAVLCFTSASRTLDVTTLPTGEPRRYNGLMLRQRGYRPLPVNVIENIRSVVNEDGFLKTRSGADGEGAIVERWWNVPADYKEMLELTLVDESAKAPTGATTLPAADPTTAAARRAAKPKVEVRKPYLLKAFMGVSPGESKLSPIGEIVANYARLEKGDPRDQNIVYLAKSTIDEMGVKVGDKVRVHGIDLEIAGTFDANEFDSRVLTLSGDSIMPLNYQTNSLDAGGQKLSDVKAETLSLDADDTATERDATYEHLSSAYVGIVPAKISPALPNASLRSVALKLADHAEVQKVVKEFTKRWALATYAGDDDGVRMCAASNLARVSGAGQVAIPIAIAGLIIFNTMMGSIAERRREIHVYTSLGLAPMHVGALFVAEAMTYGLIGTVFGYVIGQGVGTLLMHFNWLGGVTLNYSGTSAIMTMGLILVIVLLSALVPARLASKIAAPSIERSWRVPLPKGDEIEATLPFTINKTAADGVLAYLNEYFDAHQEGSIGKFSAGKVDFFHFEDEGGRGSRGLKCIIWLTPFDLGIRQHMMILVHPGQYEDIYEVQVKLTRMSGDDGSWYRMNRTFLTELRKQFLQWRSLTPQRMLQYVEESKRVLAQSTKEIVRLAPTEEVRLT